MRASRVPLLPILTIPLLLPGCGGAEPPTEYPDAVAADPDHYSVEFENDAVRLLRIQYGPGETSVMHRHPPSCSIALGEGEWTMTDPDGETMEDSAAMGDVDCVDADVHLPRNSASGAAELILVELKEGAMAGTAAAAEQPDAVAADPDHYAVEFENDAVRLLRVRYGAGEASRMHRHPAHCIVYLVPGPVTFELPDGEVVDAPRDEVGAVTCVDATVHLPRNTGTGPIEVVVVEFKGRQTLGG